MRTAKPDYLYFDPELRRILAYKRDAEREASRQAVRIWTLVGLLFIGCLIVERYLWGVHERYVHCL